MIKFQAMERGGVREVAQAPLTYMGLVALPREGETVEVQFGRYTVVEVVWDYGCSPHGGNALAEVECVRVVLEQTGEMLVMQAPQSLATEPAKQTPPAAPRAPGADQSSLF